MTEVESVGLDVSKATVVAAMRRADQTHVHTECANSVAGLTELASWLQQHGVTSATPCVIESTGDFHLLSAVTLTGSGYTVNVINPIITKRYQRASIRDVKTDAVDAARLAEIGSREPNLRPFQADLAALGAKKILSLIATLERCKQQLSASIKRFRATAEELGLAVHCQEADTIIETIDDQIASLHEQLQQRAPATAKQLAEQTRGVSSRQLAVLSAAVDGASFTDRDQLIAYVGLDVRKRESGTWRGKEKLSKRGNPFVRKTLFQIAWGLAQHHPEYKAYYDKRRREGKHYYTIMLAIARKFLRYFYAVHCAKTVELSTAV